MKKVPCILLVLICCSPAIAQNPDSESKKKTVTVTEEFLKKAEEAIVERDHLRESVKIKDAQLANRDEQIRALQALREIEQFRADGWKKAAEERSIANTLDDKIIKSFETSVGNYKVELATARQERDSARRSRWAWAAVAFGLGVALGSRAK